MKYLVEFKTFTITEGGNAFPDAQSLTRAEVEPAFAKFQSAMTQLFGEAELELIGSWKQKDISGDLDALFYSELSLPDISAKIQTAGYETKIFYGFNIVSVKFEISTGHFVQFDMFVKPLDTNRSINDIFYKSVDEEKYSTKHRVFLIFCALDSMQFDKIEKNGTVTQFNGYMFRPDGIYQFTKELKKINYKIVDRKLIADTIPKISDILFGKNYPYVKWNTYEKTLALLTAASQSTNSKLNMPLILKEYRAKLTEEGLVIPGGID